MASVSFFPKHSFSVQFYADAKKRRYCLAILAGIAVGFWWFIVSEEMILVLASARRTLSAGETSLPGNPYQQINSPDVKYSLPLLEKTLNIRIIYSGTPQILPESLPHPPSAPSP